MKVSLPVKYISAIAAVLSYASFVQSAEAQIRVDAQIHASSGSCARCDLSNKRMNGMKLKNANFAGSVFNNSNLSGGQFHGSNLTGAHFRNALLYRLEGQKVIMTEAVMEDATLTEAKLSNSTMEKINLHRADLTRGNFTGNDLRAANLINATAEEVDFTGSNFEGARLDHVNLNKAKLAESNLRDVQFGNAIVTDAKFIGADISGADLAQTQGLTQEQLDTACGDMKTHLPYGLSVPYCEGTLAAEILQSRDVTDPEMARAADRLERALKDVEIILKATPRNNRPLRRKLERIHTDISKSKAAIER